MKTLVTLVLLGGLVAFGGIFFGAWTIPGLEHLPTAASVGQSRARAIEGEAVRRLEGDVERPKSVRWGAPAEGGLGTRAGHLKESEAALEK